MRKKELEEIKEENQRLREVPSMREAPPTKEPVLSVTKEPEPAGRPALWIIGSIGSIGSIGLVVASYFFRRKPEPPKPIKPRPIKKPVEKPEIDPFEF